MARNICFVLGGTRSGKSRFAVERASSAPGRKAYIATAQPLDDEMVERIEKHRRERGREWDTYEEPLRIAEILDETSQSHGAVVLDCLTLWLSNLMAGDGDVEEEIEHFVSTLSGLREPTSVFLVSNEVGLGIVPDNALARRFRDAAGSLHQRVAAAAHEVFLMAAGLPLRLK